MSFSGMLPYLFTQSIPDITNAFSKQCQVIPLQVLLFSVI